MNVEFRKASRKRVHPRLALIGPSNSGKTFGGLSVATGLGGPIFLIDTEAGRGEYYSDDFEYEYYRLDPPFTPERYIEAMRAAVSAGAATVIIDSFSHAWAGKGGLLEYKDQVASSSRNPNQFAAWGKVTPKHNMLVEELMRLPANLIVTMRTKTAYDVQDVDGRKKPVKIGLAPVQRDGLEYEFTVVFDLDLHHNATCSKDSTRRFSGDQVHTLSPETGETLIDWMQSGAEHVCTRCHSKGSETKIDNIQAIRTRTNSRLKAELCEDCEKECLDYLDRRQNGAGDVPFGGSEFAGNRRTSNVDALQKWQRRYALCRTLDELESEYEKMRNDESLPSDGIKLELFVSAYRSRKVELEKSAQQEKLIDDSGQEKQPNEAAAESGDKG